MQRRAARYGTLDAQVLDSHPGAPPEALVVLCHGFGAPGTDLVGLGPELAVHPALAEKPVRFLFPAAPLDLSAYGMWGARAWWEIDMVALQRAMARGEPRVLAGEEPEGLGPARRALTQLLLLATAEANLPLSKVALGGFSQGAMLATDTALRLEEAVGAVLIASGTLLAEASWRRLAPARGGMQALLGHGDADPILPFAGSEALRELLSESGWHVRFVPFSGGHTIPRALVGAMAETIGDVAARPR
jgi:phospholipase/carboxylesterase